MITAHVDSAEQQLQVGRLRIVNILNVQLSIKRILPQTRRAPMNYKRNADPLRALHPWIVKATPTRWRALHRRSHACMRTLPPQAVGSSEEVRGSTLDYS